MKPKTIRQTLDEQGVSRPNLRILTPEDTKRLKLPPRKKPKKDHAAHQHEGMQASAVILLVLVAIVGAAAGIGLVLAAWRIS